MDFRVEPDFATWLETYRPLYGSAATADLHAAQCRFAHAVNGDVEANGELYRRTIGRDARHSLGEYFTPAWLANFVLDKLNYRGDGSLLDPSAGLGVFLKCALERGGAAVTGYEVNPLPAACARVCGLPVETRDRLCDPGEQRFAAVKGYEVNPLTAACARACGLPVKTRDTLCDPAEQRFAAVKGYEVNPLTAGRARACGLPVETRDTLCDPAEQRFAAVKGYEVNPLTGACARACGLPVETRDTLCDPGEQRFDYIAGNPPWVNWRYLNHGYRDRIAALWTYYGLLPRGRMGASMDDLSMLFAYFCADRLLAAGGRMALLLSKALFQSAGGGREFRRFELPAGRRLNVTAVHEIEQPLPFGGATNQTVAVLFETSLQRTVYPVPYFRGAERWEARPVAADPVSPWAIVRPGSDEFAPLRGTSPYSARVGVHTGGATGVFWVDVKEQRRDCLVIRNRGAAGQVKWPCVKAEVEPDLVRPLVRGRNVSRWNVAQSNCSIVLAHTSDGKPVPESTMREQYPQTFAYFERFRERMVERPHYKRHFEHRRWPYWSMYNVGAYTFAQYRVVWREQSTGFQCAVLENTVAVADAKLVVLPCDSSDEAYYVTGMLNSELAGQFVATFLLRIQMSTHVLRHIRVPRFQSENGLHAEMSAAALERRQSDVDQLARAIWC